MHSESDPNLENNSDISENNSQYSESSEEDYDEYVSYSSDELDFDLPSALVDQVPNPNKESPIVDSPALMSSTPHKETQEPTPEEKSKKKNRISASSSLIRKQQSLIEALTAQVQQLSDSVKNLNTQALKKKKNVDPNLTAYQAPNADRKVLFENPKKKHTTDYVPDQKPTPKINPATYSTPYKNKNTESVVDDVNEPFIEIGLDENIKFPSSVSGLGEFDGEQGEAFSLWWSHFKQISGRWSNNMRVNVILAKCGERPRAWLLNVLDHQITYSNLVIEIERAYSTLNSDVEVRQNMRKLKWDSNTKKSAVSWLSKLEANRLKLKEPMLDREFIRLILDDCVAARNKMYLNDADSYRDYLSFRSELLQHEIKWGQLLEEERNEKRINSANNNRSNKASVQSTGSTSNAPTVTISTATPATTEVKSDQYPDVTCHYCKQKGHYKSTCPKKRRNAFMRVATDPGPTEFVPEDGNSSSEDTDSEGTVQGSPGSSVAIEPVNENSTEPAYVSTSQLTQALFSGDEGTDPTLLYRQVLLSPVPRTAWMEDLIDTDDFGKPVRFTTQQPIPNVNDAFVPDFPFFESPDSASPTPELLIQFDDSPPRIKPNNNDVQLPAVVANSAPTSSQLPSPLKDIVIGDPRERLRTVTPAETTVAIQDNPMKCLLDTGSNVSLITAAALQQLAVDSFVVTSQ